MFPYTLTPFCGEGTVSTKFLSYNEKGLKQATPSFAAHRLPQERNSRTGLPLIQWRVYTISHLIK